MTAFAGFEHVFHPHDGRFVALAAVLAVFASYVSLEMATRIRISGGRIRNLWTIVSGLTLGGGAWLMHFIAMIGMKLPFPVSLDTGLTAMSFAAAAAAAAAGITITFRWERSRPALAAGGLCTGCGIAAMHYMGLSAIVMPVAASYSQGLVLLSLAIAVCAATAAFYLALSVHSLRQRILAALVMGSAIVAMHFTGMAAVIITGFDHASLTPLYAISAIDNAIADPIIDGSIVMLLVGLGLVYHDKSMRRWNLVALAQFGLNAISTQDDAAQVMTRAASTARDALDADLVFIAEINGAEFVGAECRILGAIAAPGSGMTPPPRFAIDSPASVFARAATSGAPVILSQEAGALPDAFAAMGIAAGVVVPMPSADGARGVVAVFSRTAKVFGDDEIDFLRNLAEVLEVLRSREAAIAGVARKVAQQTALAGFSIEASGSLDAAQHVAEAVRVACGVLGVEMAAVMHVYPHQDRLILVGSNIWPADLVGEHPLSTVVGNGLVATLARNATAVRFSNIDEETRFVLDPHRRPPGVKSGMGVPVKAFEDSLILFLVLSGEVRHYTDEEEEFLRTLAHITALAVERQHARELNERKMRKEVGLTQFSSAALKFDNLGDLCRVATEIMRSAMHMDYSALFEIDEDRDGITTVSLSGWSFEVPADYSLKAQPSRLYTNVLLAAEGPLIFTNMDTETRFDRSPLRDSFGIKSGIGLAVKAANGRTLALAAFSTRVRTEFADAAEFLITLGNILVSIYDRQRARENLLLRDRALASISQGIVITDEAQLGSPVIYANAAFGRMIGGAPEDAVGMSWVNFLAPDAPAGLSEYLSLMRARCRTASIDTRLRRRDGTVLSARVHLAPIVNADGDLTHYVGVHEDVTEEQRRDQQLQEAQKMEAVGQLTGGIAHDFNNLLTVVKANAEDMYDAFKAAPLQERQCGLILKAADRGADLVRQLMAFARKEELEPKVIDINVMIDGFAKLVRRTVPAHIDIDLHKAAALPRVKVDPGRLENAILNLVINARDAMPEGGTITIETGTVELDAHYARENPGISPGPYVVVAVSDTGFGMSKEILEKAFQPFFTTKEVGQGTGLGLSMVYGFVRQSGGHAKIYSEAGHGTTVKIYLPPAEAAAIAAAEPSLPVAVPQSAAGTILVVEDNDLVRESICDKLEHFGFGVTAVDCAAKALAVLEGNSGIDPVFSDVIMPGSMTGADLAREVQRRWPKIALLMTSGYTEASVLKKIQMPAGIRLLSKPYSNAELSEALQTAMGRGAAQ